MSDEHQLRRPERVSPSDPTVPDLPVPPARPPTQPNFHRRETFPAWATILLILLAIALIGGGLGLIFYTTTVQYRASLQAQATGLANSTVQARDTARAQEQATANALSTANAKIFATATTQTGVTATATALVENATATATALGVVFTQATSGTAVLNDPLSDNSGNHNWDETHGTVDGQCVFTGAAYHAKAARQGFFQPCFAESSNFTNFVYQVSMIIDKGNQAGIVFRANSTSKALYLFYIRIDGRYSLDLYKSGSQATTLHNGFSPAIMTGAKQTNQLVILAYKSILYLYVNQQFIFSLTNSTLSSGMIGVAALDLKNPTEAEFSNAQVWNITSATVLTPTATQTATATSTPTSAP
jgi:hypothetical protein